MFLVLEQVFGNGTWRKMSTWEHKYRQVRILRFTPGHPGLSRRKWYGPFCHFTIVSGGSCFLEMLKYETARASEDRSPERQRERGKCSMKWGSDLYNILCLFQYGLFLGFNNCYCQLGHSYSLLFCEGNINTIGIVSLSLMSGDLSKDGDVSLLAVPGVCRGLYAFKKIKLTLHMKQMLLSKAACSAEAELDNPWRNWD